MAICMKISRMSGTKLMTPPTPSMTPADKRGLQRTIRQRCVDQGPQPVESGLHPGHGHFSQTEGDAVHEVQNAQHDKRAEASVRENSVGPIRSEHAGADVRMPYQYAAAQQGRYEAVAIVGDNGLRGWYPEWNAHVRPPRQCVAAVLPQVPGNECGNSRAFPRPAPPA